MKLIPLLTAAALLTGSSAFANERVEAGELSPVRIVSLKATNKRIYKNLGLTTYDIVALVESSNACMVPDSFVKQSSFENGSEVITLSGVSDGRACTADFNPVTTEVFVTTLSVRPSPEDKSSSVVVNGLSPAAAE